MGAAESEKQDGSNSAYAARPMRWTFSQFRPLADANIMSIPKSLAGKVALNQLTLILKHQKESDK
jgi:hypothetical protein